MGGKRCSNRISTTLPRTEATEPRFEVLGLSPMHFPQRHVLKAACPQRLLICQHCCIAFFLVRRIGSRATRQVQLRRGPSCTHRLCQSVCLARTTSYLLYVGTHPGFASNDAHARIDDSTDLKQLSLQFESTVTLTRVDE